MNINATNPQPVPLNPAPASTEAPAIIAVKSAPPVDIRSSSKPSETENVAKKKAGANEGEVQKAVDQLNNYIQTVQRDLHFSLDKDSGALVVKVIDSKTDTVIRQMPSEESLKLARHLAEEQNNASLQIFSSRA
jgi:flagellar protein FlaG